MEPADHGLGHSRGGWTTKSHVVVDDCGHLRSVVVTPDQAGENPRLLDVLDLTGVRVGRVVADKAYSQSFDPAGVAGSAGQGNHSGAVGSEGPPQGQGACWRTSARIRSGDLQAPQRDGALLQPRQGVPGRRHQV